MKLMLPAIIPFNLIKATANGVIGAILYIPLHKSVSKYLDKQVVTDEDLATEQPIITENMFADNNQTTDINLNHNEEQNYNVIEKSEDNNNQQNKEI